MKNTSSKIYETHHSNRERLGFSLLAEERGQLFSRWIGEGKKLLDIGCRDGTLTKRFIDSNEVVGVDVDPTALKKASDDLGIKTINLNLNDEWSELMGEKFDVVLAGEVLEHVYFPEDVTKKVKNHLKTGGIFIGSVPNAFNLKNRIRFLLGTKRNTPLADPTHINQFHIKELKSMLGDHFDEVEIGAIGRYQRLANLHPGWFGYSLVFRAKLKS